MNRSRHEKVIDKNVTSGRRAANRRIRHSGRLFIKSELGVYRSDAVSIAGVIS